MSCRQSVVSLRGVAGTFFRERLGSPPASLRFESLRWIPQDVCAASEWASFRLRSASIVRVC